MQNITQEELVKMSEFINNVDGLIDGKFILADIKISNILKMIATNSSLYAYIKDCLIEFSFDKELSRAEVKNRFNNGEFKMPQEKSKIVAFVFCLLVECDAKRMDFFTFINDNFKAENETNYKTFANTVLVPFKEIIINKFFKNEPDEIEEQEEVLEEQQNIVNDIFSNLKNPLNEMLDNIALDRRIKSADKENLLYIIKNIIYSFKYKDLNIVNAFISVLDILADKYACLRLPLKDIKGELLTYYQNKY